MPGTAEPNDDYVTLGVPTVHRTFLLGGESDPLDLPPERSVGVDLRTLIAGSHAAPGGRSALLPSRSQTAGRVAGWPSPVGFPPVGWVAKEATVEAGFIIIGALVGIVLGFAIGTSYQRKQSVTLLGSAESQARSLLEDAKRQAETTRREAAVEARDEALRLRQSVETETAKLRAEVEVENRNRLGELQRREERLTAREESLEAKAGLLDRREATLHDREQVVEVTRQELESATDEHRRRLEQVAAMTAGEARAVLVKQVEEDAK